MEKVLALLEKGRGFEKAGSSAMAKSTYEEATKGLRAVLPSFSNTPTYDVLMKELLHYETKISELNGVDLFDDLEDDLDALEILDALPTVANTSALGATAPPPVPIAPGVKGGGGAKNPGPSGKGSSSVPSGWKGANNNKRLQNYENSILKDSKATDACLSDIEIEVLKSSSRINGMLFMPWLEGEEKEEGFRFDHEWCDPAGLLPLGSKQVEAGAVYLRPQEFFVSGKVNMVSSVWPDPNSIVQDCVGDCSFVCSLIIASLYECRAKKKLVSGIIYPHDSKGHPVVNKSGKYLVKLFLNGVNRKVVVDDRLPCRKHKTRPGASLLCSSSTRDNELWVSIIEKAFLKVNGGYDFAGSNSGIDLYTLTGWIPEQVHLGKGKKNMAFEHADDGDAEGGAGKAQGQGGGSSPRREVTFDHRQDQERVWSRMVSAHQFGDCLITVSTRSDLTAEEQTATGLIDSHAYAVLDVKQAGTLRMLKIKNPWAEHPWKGRFSSADRQRWTKGLRRVLGVGGESQESASAAFNQMEKEGIFYIELDDLLRYFDGIFMNWNPHLFSFRLAIHDFWAASRGPMNDLYYRGANPQYSLTVDPTLMDRGGALKGVVVSVWVLFSRHITSPKAETDNNMFMAVHIYKSAGGARIFDNPRPYIKGLYSNNPHQLVRIDVDMSDAGASSSGGGNELTVVLSQMDKSQDVNFSVSTYGTTPYIFRHAPSPGKFKYEFTGTFDAAGCGTSSHNSFFTNPHYALTALEGPSGGSGDHGTVAAHVEAFFSQGISAAIHVVESDGKKKRTIRLDGIPDSKESGQTVQDSGPYRQGYCHIPTVRLRPGCSYIVVLSTYKQHPHGGFRFNVYSHSSQIRCEAIPPQGEGLIHRRIEGCFEEDLHQGQKGGSKMYPMLDRLLIQPTVGTQALPNVRVMARLRLAGTANFPTHLGLFSNPPDASKAAWTPKPGSTPDLLASTHSGVYMDTPCGVLLDYNGPWPDHGKGFVVIPSCFDRTSAKYHLDVHTSCNVVMRWEKQQQQ